MTGEEIIKEFNALPLEAQKKVESFVITLRKSYGKKNGRTANGDLIEEKFVGMWKDREDLPDGEVWVRELGETSAK